MTDDSYAPTIRTQADLEDTWRHLMRPLGFGGHSLWLMLIQADGVPLPHLTQIEEAVEPPTDEQLTTFVGLLSSLHEEMGRGERLVFLRSRPGRGGADARDRRWAASLYAACRAAGVPTDVVHVATDDSVVPVPMDALPLARPA